MKNPAHAPDVERQLDGRRIEVESYSAIAGLPAFHDDPGEPVSKQCQAVLGFASATDDGMGVAVVSTGSDVNKTKY